VASTPGAAGSPPAFVPVALGEASGNGLAAVAGPVAAEGASTADATLFGASAVLLSAVRVLAQKIYAARIIALTRHIRAKIRFGLIIRSLPSNYSKAEFGGKRRGRQNHSECHSRLF